MITDLLLVIIVLLLYSLISFISKHHTAKQEEKWIRTPGYPVYPQASIEQAYRDVINASNKVSKIYQQWDSFGENKSISRNNPETFSVEYIKCIKNYFRANLEHKKYSRMYASMVEVNIDVTLGKSKIDDEKNDLDSISFMNIVSDHEVEKEYKEYLSRLKKEIT